MVKWVNFLFVSFLVITFSLFFLLSNNPSAIAQPNSEQSDHILEIVDDGEIVFLSYVDDFSNTNIALFKEVGGESVNMEDIFFDTDGDDFKFGGERYNNSRRGDFNLHVQTGIKQANRGTRLWSLHCS